MLKLSHCLSGWAERLIPTVSAGQRPVGSVTIEGRRAFFRAGRRPHRATLPFEGGAALKWGAVRSPWKKDESSELM